LTNGSPADEQRGDHLIVVNSRGGDGLGVSFKVEGRERSFRLEPARDPNQPRFWCFRIYRCTAAGVVAQDERSWWGSGGMTRNDLPATVQAIRADPDGWLANEALSELREWIFGTDGPPDAAAPLPSRSVKAAGTARLG
jgi:hypothetical protein